MTQRRPDYRRAPGDSAATGTLLRLAHCIGGRVEVVVNAAPIFEYGTASGIWDYDGEGYGVMTVHPPVGDPALTVTSSVRLGVAAARCYGRSTLDSGESAFVALSWGGAPPTSVEEAAGSAGRHGRATGGTGCRPARSPITHGAATSSAAP